MLSVQYTEKGKLPGLSFDLPALPFEKMQDHVLGRDYDLSLVFIDPEKMQELNRTYRQKDYATDILSFPLSDTSGEIFICLNKVEEKAKLFGRSTQDHLGFLFIHGLLHLKGLDHGSKMEEEEKSISAFFGIKISDVS